MSGILKAATSVSAGTLVSRIMGLARDVMMLNLLGANWAMGSFVLAWMFPNMLRRLFGEGALSASFIPAFAASLDRHGLPAARRLLAAVSGVLLAILGTLTLLVLAGCLVLPPAALHLSGTGGVTPEQRGRLLLALTIVLFPYCIPICCAAIYGGALNAFHVFWAPAVSPAMLNVFWIGGALCAAHAFPQRPDSMALCMAVFLMAGGIVQLVLTMTPLWRRGCLPAPRWPSSGDGSGPVFRAMLPTVLGLSMVQLNLLMDQTLAEYLVGPGANTHIYLANRLLLFPHALTSLALATAVFPRFAVLASRAQGEALRHKVHQALYWTLFLTLPAAAGLVAIAPDFIDVLLVHGEFTPQDGRLSARTTMVLVAGLPFIGIAQLYARALYALGDTRGPAVIASLLLLVNFALNLLFVLGLGFSVAGFTLATSVCAVLNAMALHRRFQRACPGAPMPLWPLLRVAAATFFMLLLVFAARHFVQAHSRLEKALLYLALPIGLGAGGYFAGNLAIGGRAALRH